MGGQLVDSKQTLGKDDMINMIRHGAKHIFNSKGDEIGEKDIDVILKMGETKTEETNKKLKTYGESSLRSLSLDSRPEDSVYKFEGEDFREKSKETPNLDWIAPPKR